MRLRFRVSNLIDWYNISWHSFSNVITEHFIRKRRGRHWGWSSVPQRTRQFFFIIFYAIAQPSTYYVTSLPSLALSIIIWTCFVSFFWLLQIYLSQVNTLFVSYKVLERFSFQSLISHSFAAYKIELFFWLIVTSLEGGDRLLG